jgi:phosphoglycerate dehydrogenase-like enzyme
MSNILDILIITNSIFTINEEYRETIKTVDNNIKLTIVKDSEVTSEMLYTAEVMFGWPTEEQLQQAENLKWLHLPSAGADGYTKRELYKNSSEIQISNSSGVFGKPIAEHVFTMILSYNRNFSEYTLLKTEKKWQRNFKVKDFFGSTLGIIGLGDIGTEVAMRAKAWGANVIAVKRTITEVPEYVDRLYTLEEIDEVLKQSDYVVLALPNTMKTKGIIDENKLRLMKPEAFLINVGRGSLIDQDALITALKEGWIGGAGLDVTEPEPLPEDNPLWDLPGVIITPHASGTSPSNDQRRFDIFYHNLLHYRNQEPLRNTVNFEEGY